MNTKDTNASLLFLQNHSNTNKSVYGPCGHVKNVACPYFFIVLITIKYQTKQFTLSGRRLTSNQTRMLHH